MTLNVLGLDHIYIVVSDLESSTAFYDDVMKLLGFCKGSDPVGGQPHIHYFNHTFQYTLRPAKLTAATHDPLIPGLHYLCFRVVDKKAVAEAAEGLRKLGITISEPRIYPEYGDDYYAIYFKDPDGIELEIVNQTQIRNFIRENWDKLEHFENPLSKAGLL